MAHDLARTPHWRKSTRSGNSGNCVEAATNLPHLVFVRDSKDAAGPELAVGRGDWQAFVLGLRTGQIAE